MNHTAAYGRRRRVLYIKDPASAITHFIGAVGSAGASVPLLIKAAQTGRPLALFAMAVYSLMRPAPPTTPWPRAAGTRPCSKSWTT